MIAIDETNGYKIYDQVARYYALATVQIIVEKDWFNTVSIGDTVSNLTAQSSFMTAVGNADNRTAMLWDGSYWYNESVAAENISFHQTMNPTNPDLNLSYMPMPTQLYGQVAEGEGKKNTLLDIGSAQLFVNQRVSEDPGLERACREFVEFLYSDAELAAFTEKTGQFRPIEYSYDKSKMSGFYQNMDAIRNKSDVVYFASDSELFKNNFTSFTLTWSGAINRPIIDGAEVAAGSIKAMRLHGTTKASAVNIFNLTRKTQSGWEQLIK